VGAEPFGGRENLDAVAFLRSFTRRCSASFRTPRPRGEIDRLAQVRAPWIFGGLGFGYKWNMGWMHERWNISARIDSSPAHHGDIPVRTSLRFFGKFHPAAVP